MNFSISVQMLAGFGASLIAYFSGSAQSFRFYTGLGVVTHLAVTLSRRGARASAKAR